MTNVEMLLTGSIRQKESEMKEEELHEMIKGLREMYKLEGFFPPPWALTRDNEEKTSAFLLGQMMMKDEIEQNGAYWRKCLDIGGPNEKLEKD